MKKTATTKKAAPSVRSQPAASRAAQQSSDSGRTTTPQTSPSPTPTPQTSPSPTATPQTSSTDATSSHTSPLTARPAQSRNDDASMNHGERRRERPRRREDVLSDQADVELGICQMSTDCKWRERQEWMEGICSRCGVLCLTHYNEHCLETNDHQIFTEGFTNGEKKKMNAPLTSAQHKHICSKAQLRSAKRREEDAEERRKKEEKEKQAMEKKVKEDEEKKRKEDEKKKKEEDKKKKKEEVDRKKKDAKEAEELRKKEEKERRRKEDDEKKVKKQEEELRKKEEKERKKEEGDRDSEECLQKYCAKCACDHSHKSMMMWFSLKEIKKWNPKEDDDNSTTGESSDEAPAQKKYANPKAVEATKAKAAKK